MSWDGWGTRFETMTEPRRSCDRELAPLRRKVPQGSDHLLNTLDVAMGEIYRRLVIDQRWWV